MQVKTIDFVSHGDGRGELVAIEALKDIPFEIKRIYYITGTGEGIRRGYHAHKELKQVLICIKGQCKVLLDDGTEKTDVLLDSPSHGILIDRPLWRELYDFSEDAALLAIVSDYYTENDYIRNYDDFMKYIKESK